MKTLLFVCLLAMTGCSSALYVPSEDMADKELLAELREGRKLYVQNCSSCHNLYLPSQVKRSAWEFQLMEMQKKALINDESRELILQYLMADPSLSVASRK